MKNNNMFFSFRKFCVQVILISIGMLGRTLLTIIRLFIPLRVGRLVSERIGHLGPNTEIFLRRLSANTFNQKERYLFVAGKPANRQLLTMIKRRIMVIENEWLVKIYNTIEKLTKDSKLWVDLPFETNEYDVFSNYEPQLFFTKEEEKKGVKLLESMGISSEGSYVCFHSRDKSYLTKIYPKETRERLSYHDFRDCSINNYMPAAEYLAQKGIYALRMGAVVEEEIDSKNDLVIDYAKSYRSDFADMYVPTHCKFFLGCTAGYRLMATMANIPIAFANSVPLGDAALREGDVFIPKKYWSVDKKKFLTFKEIVNMKADWWLRGELYESAGIEVIENTSDEILDLTKELNDRIDGVWVETEEDRELQNIFRSLFPKEHRCYGFPSKVGASFLRQNKKLLDFGISHENITVCN